MTAQTLDAVLTECINEFKKDNFLNDLAKPLKEVLKKLKEADESLEDEKKAEPLRSDSQKIITLVNAELVKFAARGMLEAETLKVQRCIKACNQGKIALNLTVPSGGELEIPAEALKVSKSPEALASEGEKNSDPFAKTTVTKRDLPYQFQQTADVCEMTVTIRVNPGTKPKDVDVSVHKKSLRVKVKGHALQPVIDGTFPHPVDVDSCMWSLEGNGDKRSLVINLEKTMGGLKWPGLLIEDEEECLEPAAPASAVAPATTQPKGPTNINDFIAEQLKGTDMVPWGQAAQ
ncbi:hypothetical protein CYMTET_40191 [Cymbomonas tetramitiformis]|uniref:CS domain-containing protein n=1 Tax=Cymbomonas tetramitiformis TaxID=36881 RepID=A0AAE0C9T2_9CHLO|nr:hypothetical protein CYMTET_40191 [Cymbomonas tetramitiformis]|eukprot:gene24330-29559_t